MTSGSSSFSTRGSVREGAQDLPEQKTLPERIVAEISETFGYPCVAKVPEEGSSFGMGIPKTAEDLAAHARTTIAGYKVPKEVHLVDEIVRSPSGKADYRWAKSIATGQA